MENKTVLGFTPAEFGSLTAMLQGAYLSFLLSGKLPPADLPPNPLDFLLPSLPLGNAEIAEIFKYFILDPKESSV